MNKIFIKSILVIFLISVGTIASNNFNLTPQKLSQIEKKYEGRISR